MEPIMQTNPNVLPDGWTISPRLMACYTFNDGSTLEYSDGEGYRLQNAYGIPIAVGTDYRPSPLAKTWSERLAPLVGFLGSDAGSYDYFYMRAGGKHPDDGYCFGDEIAEWAYMHSDELEMLSLYLEEGSDA